MAKVLIIDDDPLVRDSLARVIKKMGHGPVEAGFLASARDKLRGEDLDLVFCDVKMPNGYGLEILTEIRESAA